MIRRLEPCTWCWWRRRDHHVVQMLRESPESDLQYFSAFAANNRCRLRCSNSYSWKCSKLVESGGNMGQGLRQPYRQIPPNVAGPKLVLNIEMVWEKFELRISEEIFYTIFYTQNFFASIFYTQNFCLHQFLHQLF